MAFWSGDTLRARLPTLVDTPDYDCIDCAAYMLKVGPEYYVTPSDQSSDPKTATLKTLKADEAFAIPPGQFAFVLTQEIVTIPKNVLGFISIRARIKWKGLINVSGFHVDPGYSDRLTFSVYNAGPTPIHLRQGDPTFLIWFADLDGTSAKYVKPSRPPVAKMDLTILNQVAGEVHSLQGLADTIRQTEKDLAARITTLERANGVVAVAAGVLLTLAAGFAVHWISKQMWPAPSVPVAAGATTQASSLGAPKGSFNAENSQSAPGARRPVQPVNGATNQQTGH